jgi:hypothetical protein
MKAARNFIIAVLALTVCENTTFASSQKVYAVLRNETEHAIKVRIESASGYSLFGIFSKNVFTELVDRTARLTISLQNGRTLQKVPLLQRSYVEIKLDVTHNAVYLRVKNNGIELVAPSRAKGWWTAGLPNQR